jgi:glycerol-1-phosphate dehydrogenase [NAD(P)+]
VGVVYGPTAPAVAELQAKTGFYNEGKRIERLAAIKAHWEEILALLAEAPTGEEIAAMLTRAGFTEREYYRTYGSRMIGESIVWAKDLKDRYTLFNMLEDLGVLEAMAGAYVREYLG